MLNVLEVEGQYLRGEPIDQTGLAAVASLGILALPADAPGNTGYCRSIACDACHSQIMSRSARLKKIGLFAAQRRHKLADSALESRLAPDLGETGRHGLIEVGFLSYEEAKSDEGRVRLCVVSIGRAPVPVIRLTGFDNR